MLVEFALSKFIFAKLNYDFLKLKTSFNQKIILLEKKLIQEKDYSSFQKIKLENNFFLEVIEQKEILDQIKFPDNKKDFKFLILEQKINDIIYNNNIISFGEIDEKYNFLLHEIDQNQKGELINISLQNITIKHIIKLGYKFNDRILRKAIVLVK